MASLAYEKIVSKFSRGLDGYNTIFVKMRQNGHFETTTCKTSKIVVEGKEKHVLCNEYRETERTRLERITMQSALIASSKAIFLLIDS